MTTPLASVGIMSIGEMGLGIAKLLIAHDYRVVTNIAGRGPETEARARNGKVEILDSVVELVQQADYILSIVPPKDAMNTAQRILMAVESLPEPRPTPLYFLELNAVSPNTVRNIAALFDKNDSVVFIDGGIIGGAPRPQSSTDMVTTVSTPGNLSPKGWTRPSIPISGPNLASAPNHGAELASLLNIRHISPSIGTASGLKMCFASTTKGFIAIAIQAFTTAHSLGVLDELRAEMERMTPAMLKTAEGGVVGMAPKAYRWVREMEEIASTHHEEGGFEEELFSGVAEVYRSVAEETVLGREKTGKRVRGTSMDDVAAAMEDGLKAMRKKRE